jgi:thiol-disulfide isomerase/thioredoxin
VRYLLIEDLSGPPSVAPTGPAEKAATARCSRPVRIQKGRPEVTYIVVALVVTNVLTLLNLLLLFGVIRRLRELPAGGLPGPSSLQVGAQIEGFATVDVDGCPLRSDDLPEAVVVGFFSPGCAPCEALLPKFVAHAEGLSGGRESVLAVVAGTPGEAASYAARLSPVARVVVEEPAGGVVVRAFQVSGYPTVFQLDGDGRVLVSGASLDRLAVPTA